MSDFTETVKAVVRAIPAGSVMTYGEVAAATGKPTAARAVANVMAKNFDPAVPCHRVIRGDGGLGGYNRGGEPVKRQLLEREGAIKRKHAVFSRSDLIQNPLFKPRD